MSKDFALRGYFGTILFLVFVCGLCASGWSAHADKPSTLNVKVTDPYYEGIPGALLEIIELEKNASTDFEGVHTFYLEESGSFTLRVSALGFKTYTLRFEVSSAEEKQIAIQLEEEVTELDEVVVKSSVEQLAGNETFTPDVLSLESIRATPQAVPHIIGQLPGIRIRQEGGVGSDANIMLNGIGGKGVRVFMDDLPVYLLGNAFNINNISPNMISRIEVYKGLIPVKFGSDALGGVVNIVSRYGNAEYLDASYTYGSWNTHQASFNSRKFLDKNDQFFVSLDGFYNYSDNDYWMKGVEIVTDTVNFNTDTGKSRRFNDTFESILGRLQVGAQNLSWADQLILSAYYSQIYKEWQHGIKADRPWGEPYSDEDSWSSAVTWSKQGKNNQWNAKVTAGYSFMKLHFVDTAFKRYYWDQNYQNTPLGGESDLYTYGTTPEIKTRTFFSRASVNYELNPVHTLNLTLLMASDELRGRNKVLSQDDQSKFGTPQTLLKNYSGLALESSPGSTDITNILSVKHYYSDAEGLEYLSAQEGFGDLIRTTSSLFGYGDVVQYQLKKLTLSVGYEFTVRQPDKEEIFGDYITIAPNAELQPEKSHNVNLGMERKQGDSKLSYGLSLYYRNTQDQIFIDVLSRGLSRYINLFGTETLGGNAQVTYLLIDGLRANMNVTYQNTELSETDDSSLKDNIGKKVPNVPFFFGNAQLSYINDQLVKSGKLNLTYDFNYVDEFFLSWDQQASNQDLIPTQLLHNISISWIESKDRWSLGLECRNLFDALAYDNFSVQKPGRSFYVKTRFFIGLK